MRSTAVLVLLIAAGFLVAGVSAATPLSGWKRDDAWSQAARELHFNIDPQGFVFESRRQAQDADDVLIGRFNLRQAEFRLERLNQSGAGDVRDIRIAFTRLIEYQDTDADLAYEATDATLRVWNVHDAVVPLIRDTPAPDGAHEAVATYDFDSPVEDGQDQPRVELRFHISPQMQTRAGLPVLPTETKLDIEIHDVPYNSTDSRIAAEFQVTTDAPAQASDDALQTDAGPTRFAVGWQPTATVDGLSRPVGTSIVPASDTAHGIYFSYARGDDIRHDPTIGAYQYEAQILQPLADALGKGSPLLYALGIVGAAVLVGTTTYLRARK
jgi:hypothetical protein